VDPNSLILDPEKDSDPAFNDPKFKQNSQLKKSLINFLVRIPINLSLGLHKVHPNCRRSLQPSKENPALKNKKFLSFFPVLRIQIRIPFKIRILMRSLNPYPDLHSGFGSRTAKMTHKHRKKLINFSF
jgi:hypothetical protein